MSRIRIKDIDRGGHILTVPDVFKYLKDKGESVVVYQHGSRYYRGRKCVTIITDQSTYAVWEDRRKHYSAN